LGLQFDVMFDSFMDDVTYVRHVEVCVQRMICYIPGCIYYGSEDFGFGSLHDDCWTCWHNPTVLVRSFV